MHKKCYIYTRVSTAAQVEGYSLNAQVECLKQYADYRELDIAGEYCDAGRSGHSIKGRPAFVQMIDDVMEQKDQVSFVLVYKLSRFGRNAADVLKTMQTLMDFGVDLVCVEDGIDSSTQGGRLTMAILSAVAEIERENITIQFSAGRMQKIQQGGWPGGPAPYGYRLENKKLVIVPEEAAMVKKIHDLYEHDMGISTVAIYLNEHGYKRMVKGNFKPYTYDFVSQVLDNEVYCGRIVFGRRNNDKSKRNAPKNVVTVKGNHEPIISEEQWEKNHQKRNKFYVPNTKIDDIGRVSLLSGIIKCPCCGAGMITKKSKSINKNKGGYYKNWYAYGCRNYRKTSGRICSFNTTFHQEKVDEAVFEIFSNLTMLPEFKEKIVAEVGNHNSVDELEEKLAQLRKQLRKEEQRKRKLGENLDDLNIMDDNYDSKYEAIQSRMEAIYDRIEVLDLKIEDITKKLSLAQRGIRAADQTLELIDSMKKLYFHMSDEEKREMYLLFIDHIEVCPDRSEGKIIKSISFKIPVFYDNYEAIPQNKPDEEIEYVLDCSKTGLTVAESKASYAKIKSYIAEKYDLKVSSLYIAQIKRKYGIEMGTNYNVSTNPEARVPKCPKEKEEAIVETLKHFRMLSQDVIITDDGEDNSNE